MASINSSHRSRPLTANKKIVSIVVPAKFGRRKPEDTLSPSPLLVQGVASPTNQEKPNQHLLSKRVSRYNVNRETSKCQSW
jgi:hypothetical protein